MCIFFVGVIMLIVFLSVGFCITVVYVANLWGLNVC